ncbi:MAG: hypothetical protein AAFZ80_04620, partial [Cyanobacteria bacterium P01_A01_bin.105]
LLPALKQLPESEKLQLVRLLAAELFDGTDISPFEPFKTYILPTPYNAFGAGVMLMQAMPAAD